MKDKDKIRKLDRMLRKKFFKFLEEVLEEAKEILKND